MSSAAIGETTGVGQVISHPSPFGGVASWKETPHEHFR